MKLEVIRALNSCGSFISTTVTQFIRRRLFLLGAPQNLLPLSEHVEVHGGEEGDVADHDAQDEEGEGEGHVDGVGQVDGEEVLLVAWGK